MLTLASEEPPPAPDREPNDEEREKIKTTLEGVLALLEEYIRKLGISGVIITVNGQRFGVADLKAALGKVLTFLEARQLAIQARSGNPDVAAIAAFLMGLAAGAGATFILKSPLAGFFIALVTNIAVEYAINLALQRLRDAFEVEYNRLQTQNPDNTSVQNFIIFLEQMFGAPPNPFRSLFNEISYDPFSSSHWSDVYTEYINNGGREGVRDDPNAPL